MNEKVLTALSRIEEEKNITILYACESGSRAWGFPSMDSDYDVRFLYTHSIDWYLSVEDRKDHFDDVGKVLDFSGWELRKSLKLFRASNAGLYEKLQSPIVYKEVKGFRDELWSKANDYFLPKAGIYHYLSLAHNFMVDELQADHVKLKKYFYAIRSVLAARWIQLNNEIPPMEFAHLRVLIDDSGLQSWLDEMLEIKQQGNESLLVDKNKAMNEYLSDAIREGDDYTKTTKNRPKGNVEPLDKLLKQWIFRH